MHFLHPMCLAALLISPTAAAESWPDFRGPGAQGHSDATGLPLRWSETKNVKWKTPIEGRAWSSPVVWGDQIWMTAAPSDGKRLYAVCVDLATGRPQRRIKVFDVAEPETINGMNSYASPSPVIEPGRVYVHFGTSGTACIDTADGKILWSRRDLKLAHKEGPGSSPILYRDLLIFHCDGMDVQYIVALDKTTGKTAWKTNRGHDYSGYRMDLRKAYSTPLVVKVHGKDRLITTAAHAAFGYDPRTGRQLWKLNYEGGFSNVSRPVAADGMMYLNTGFMRPELLGVRLGGTGNVTDSHLAWTYQRSVPLKPSPVLVDGLIYLISDKGGVLTCLDGKSGEAVWTERLGGNYSASPLNAQGRIYFFSHEGKTTVVKPGRKFELLAENELDDGFMASPAVGGKALILRTRTNLYRIER